MAYGIIDDRVFEDIAAAIRAKNGSENKYEPSEMADAIKELSTTLVINVSEDGVVTATCGRLSAAHKLSNGDDADFLARNIKSGVTIFGVTGTYGGVIPDPDPDPDPCNHDYELTSTTATCAKSGLETWTCRYCGDWYTVEVDAYGHNWSDWEPLDNLTCHRYCLRGEDCDLNDGSETADHIMVDGVCTRCGYVEEREKVVTPTISGGYDSVTISTNWNGATTHYSIVGETDGVLASGTFTGTETFYPSDSAGGYINVTAYNTADGMLDSDTAEETYYPPSSDDYYACSCGVSGMTYADLDARYDGDGTHALYCTNCGKKTGLIESCYDNDNDGYCDRCGDAMAIG